MLEPTVGSPYIFEYTISKSIHGIVTGYKYAFIVVATNDAGISQ